MSCRSPRASVIFCTASGSICSTPFASNFTSWRCTGWAPLTTIAAR
jgi:hypothetical protein